ncbi:hypothetical protein [Streptomyces cylindrosporus]|uniref:Uncharacterized protein n=1 Tax=Streptomyces cylindrosporus TaxID=2927583 RepID=A0ABS9YIC7_9ACTN|nr:hypothetical protein [Streptomyces cylindrosporus]MCI3276995.1 hypothetical protein [Streptomyces cylindrosporus]
MKPQGGSDCDGVRPAPRVSTVITQVAAEEAVRAILDVRNELERDPDVNASSHLVPQARTATEQLALLYGRAPARPSVHAVAGVPHANQFWRETTHRGISVISRRIRGTLWERDDLRSNELEIIGPHGGRASRLSRIRQCIAHDQPFLSVALCGNARDLLIHGNPWTASLSILAKVPGEPLSAAVATMHNALSADCSDAYRLLLPDGLWKLRTEDDTRHPPAPGYVILPRQLRDFETLLERFYSCPQFVDDTATAIAEALLSNHVPLAVHYTGHVLEAAVVLVAATHKFVVRTLAPNGTVLAPWQCSSLLADALSNDVGIPRLVVGRDEFNAKNLAQHLARVPLAAS